MDDYGQILNSIYDAIDEVNRSLEPEQMLEKSPETVLLGEGKLDSLQFLNFTVAVEERIERAFKKTISVTEVALLGDESDQLTIAGLADRIKALTAQTARPGVGVAS